MSHDILLSEIAPDKNQPRKHFDEAGLEELAQSIEASGLAVPILLRPNGNGYIIVHGERRYRAVRSLGWESIPAEVRDVSPDEAGWLSLVENVQRNDLSPIEEAQAYKRRLEEGITQVELGRRIGKSQSYIATKLRLLKLPDDVQQALDAGAITEGHGKQLLRLKDPATQSFIAERVGSKQLSVAYTRLLIDEFGSLPSQDFKILVDFSITMQLGENELKALESELKAATGIEELKSIADRALYWQNTIAKKRLDVIRRGGELFRQLQEAEERIENTVNNVWEIKRKVIEVRQILKGTNQSFESWLAHNEIPPGFVSRVEAATTTNEALEALWYLFSMSRDIPEPT